MNKKLIRGIVISGLLLIILATAILNINIEPANKVVDEPKESLNLSEKINIDKEAEEKPEAPEKEHSQAKVSEAVKEPDVSIVPLESKAEEVPLTANDKHLCTIEIRCDTIAGTDKLENPAVAPYIPSDGVILAACEVEYTPGESVFDILLRTTKEKNIHMEFRDDNSYNGKYIEGINFLYEMDGGPLSGWMYKVNGKFPNYGCASYKVNDNDIIVWMYTCDLGMDVGDNSTW